MKRQVLFFIILLLFGTTNAFAQGGTTGPLTWNINNFTLTISGNGAMPDYGFGEAPWYQYKGNFYTVVMQNGVINIGALAFYDLYLSSIIIPNSVTSIGYQAFRNCGLLSSITIPNSVTTIGEQAFLSCSNLTSITIPHSVTNIGNGAFQACVKLLSIDVESGNNTYASENGVLFNKSKSILILCPQGKTGTYVIPNSTTNIRNQAFAFCANLTSITIPHSVTSIGAYAFMSCRSLISITIPNSITTIEEWTFYGCESLTLITIPNSVTTIGNGAFENCRSLTSITIPNSVTSIGSVAFRSCRSLTAINVESGNNTYASENGVLFNKSKTTLICCPEGKADDYVMPNSVATIAHGAFSSCTNLASITISSNVTNIGDGAFSGCRNLSSITNLNPVPIPIEFHVFYEVPRSASLKVPMESVSAYKNAAIWREFNIIGINVGIENREAVTVKLYPNPTTRDLRIESEDLRIENVVIYDVFGKIQKTEKQKMENTFDISHLPAGVYFVRISTEVGQVVRKVLKE